MFALVGCAGPNSSDLTPAGGDGGSQNATSGAKGGAPTVQIVDHGFGQSDQSALGIVIVTTDSSAAVGEFVTVSANFLDSDGQIIATEEQVESFSWVGQQLVLPVQLFLSDKPGVQVSGIEPSATISTHGLSEPVRAPLPTLEATEVAEGKYGGYRASFGFTNESDTDLKSLRVGAVCYDTAGTIIGGAYTFPDLAPAGKTIRIDTEPTVSEKPASCKAFLNYGLS